MIASFLQNFFLVKESPLASKETVLRSIAACSRLWLPSFFGLRVISLSSDVIFISS